MRAYDVAVAVTLIALLWSGSLLGTEPECRPGEGCLDERGPMHPLFAFDLVAVGAIVAGLASVLKRRVRPVWFAAGLGLVATVATVPLLIQRLPRDLLTWGVPAAALWIAVAALAMARPAPPAERA